MVALSVQSQERRLLLEERLAVVVSVALVLVLVAGLTGVVVKRRHVVELTAGPRAADWTAQWSPGDQPEPYVPQAATEAPLPDVVVTVTPDETQTAAPLDIAKPPAPASVYASPAPAAKPQPAPAPQPQPQPQPQPAPPAPAPAPAPPADPRMHTASSESDSERIFREQFPVQAAARQAEGDRSTFHWAVLIGVNAYQGRTKDTIGSVADATLMRTLLLQRGWREDHILLLTDANATHDNIIRGMEWLARSTDERSAVVFSYSGHMRYQKGDPDGDGEARDSGLWPTDNRYIWDSDFARMMNAVRAQRMWVSLQGCHAGGMNDRPLEAPGRVVTYSSLESQKSYEDPEVGHSVTGWFMFAEGIRDRYGDANRDGQVSAQEAHAWATPRAHTRTAKKQSMQIADGLGRPFFLEIS